MAQLPKIVGSVEVSQATGLGVDDFGLLCADLQVELVSDKWQAKVPHVRAYRINKWSFRKPIIFPSPISPTDLQIRMNKCGLNPTIIGETDTLEGVFVKIDAGTNEYPYCPSTGTASSPHRISDFSFYQKDKPECYLSINETLESVKVWTYNNATAQVSVSYINWETLHILQLIGCIKFSDIWFDSSGTSKLSDYWLTVVIKTYAGNWYVKSLFQISDKVSSINYNSIDEILNFDTIYTMPRSWQTVERRYFLTRDEIEMANPQFYGIELTQSLSDLTNTTGYHIPVSPACYMPIIKPVLHNSFYVRNDINFSLYQLLTVVNNTANTYSLKIGHLLSSDYNYDNTDWMKNGQGVIESYTVGQGVYEEITVGINKLFVNKMYKVIMTLSANDEPILHFYKNGARVLSGTWDALGAQIYGTVTGYMWRWGGIDGVQVTSGVTLGGEDALTLYVGTPKHYLTVHAESGYNTGFTLDVSFENPDFSDISNHVIAAGGSFRFEIPADDTIIGLYAEFTGEYTLWGNEDLNLTVTEVGYTSNTVNLEVQPTDPLGTVEHAITISGLMV